MGGSRRNVARALLMPPAMRRCPGVRMGIVHLQRYEPRYLVPFGRAFVRVARRAPGGVGWRSRNRVSDCGFAECRRNAHTCVYK